MSEWPRADQGLLHRQAHVAVLDGLLREVEQHGAGAITAVTVRRVERSSGWMSVDLS